MFSPTDPDVPFLRKEQAVLDRLVAGDVRAEDLETVLRALAKARRDAVAAKPAHHTIWPNARKHP